MVSRPSKSILLRSMRLSLDDIRLIFRRLSELVSAEADRELGEIPKPEERSDEEHQAVIADLRARAFRITVTIEGKHGESLFGDDETVFQSPNLPQVITRIFLTNVTAYQGVANLRPTNGFSLHVDFSKPPLLDANTFVSSPTPNNGNFTAEGATDAWVAAAIEAVDGIVRHRKLQRSLIHKGFSYDFGMFFLAAPIAIYVCTKVEPFVTSVTANTHSFLAAAMYLYVFLLTLYGYRVLYGYTKWAFPTVELSDNKDSASKHRLFWSAIVIAIAANFVFELIKLMAR